MRLTRLAWRTVAARPLRSFLTIIGIALGVAVLTASLTLGAALDAAVDRTVRDMVGRADLRVSGFLESGLSDASVATLGSTPGVVDAAPVIEHRTFTSGSPNNATSDAITVLGVDPTSYLRVHDLTLAAGHTLDSATEPVALVTEELAASDGYTIGSKLSLLGAGGLTEVRVIGILPGFGPIAGTGRTVVAPIEVTRTAFGLHGASRVDLRLEPGALTSVKTSLESSMNEPGAGSGYAVPSAA